MFLSLVTLTKLSTKQGKARRFPKDDSEIMATERTDADWESFIQSNISDSFSSSTTDLLLAAGPALASISSPTDPRFPLAIDHTLLKPDATPAQIDALCDEAIKYGFKVGNQPKKRERLFTLLCFLGWTSRKWLLHNSSHI